MQLHQKLLGHPFVYNKVRPFVIGGIDMSPVYARLELKPSDSVLDIGCGTGDALNYLSGYTRYLGADTDAVAIESAKQRHGARANTEFRCGLITPEEVQELQPTVVVLAGLLHHLSDEIANSVLRLSAAPSVRRIVTQDIVYLSGVEHWVSNAFAALDRGRFCRRPDGYRELVRRAGIPLVADDLIWADTKSRRARYFVMTLVS